jgi:predicted  nucleic acid-binding Zn-ribbon protein
MATATAKRPRTSVEAVPQLATLPERVAVLEVKMTNLDEKMDNLKDDLKTNHNSIIDTLQVMRDESTKQHNELAGKVKDLESYKNKWIKYSIGALAFAAGAGWIHAANFPAILKFLGL